MYEELKCEVEGGILMAAEANQVACMEYFHSRGEPLTPKLAAAAAKANSLQCLTYIQDFGGVWDVSALTSAAANGSLECVKFLLENGKPLSVNDLDKILFNASKNGHGTVVEYLWDTCSNLVTSHSELRVCLPAAALGHLSLLRFAHARSFECFSSPPHSASTLMQRAARCGLLPCVEFLYSVDQLGDARVFTAAARGGQVAVLRFLLEHNCPIDPTHHAAEALLCSRKVSFDEVKPLFDMGLPFDARTMAAAAAMGNLEGMKHLRERGCPWDEHTCDRASLNGQLACLRFAHESGCPWRETGVGPPLQWSVAVYAAAAPTPGCLKYVVEQGVPLNCGVAVHALQRGSMPALQFLLSVGCPLDVRASAAAAGEHACAAASSVPAPAVRAELLRLLWEHNCPWDERTCHAAARRGDLECLRFAHENGCPWDTTVCAAEAVKGSMECLEYAHTNGCPWDEMTCAGAAAAKSYEILKYARDHGCPWDARTCASAARITSLIIGKRTPADETRALDFLKFLHEQGCPWDQETCRAADSRALYEYAVAHGCAGAEQSRFHNPAYSDAEHWEEIMFLMNFH